MPTECYPTGKRVTPKEIVEIVQSERWSGGRYLPSVDPREIGFKFDHQQDRYVPNLKNEIPLMYYWLYAAELSEGVVLLHGRDWPEKASQRYVVTPIAVPKGPDGLIGLEEFVQSGNFPEKAGYYLKHQTPEHICSLLIGLGILTPNDLRMAPQNKARIC